MRESRATSSWRLWVLLPRREAVEALAGCMKSGGTPRSARVRIVPLLP